MTKYQVPVLTLVFLFAIGARLCSLPSTPFFCDLPNSIGSIEAGTMRIQFPGYVPFHLTIRALGSILGGPFAGAVFFSLVCGIGALLYCVLFAYDRAGFTGALLTSVLMGLSPIAVYFSCVGSSYTTDLLAMSALLYHGNRALTNEGGRDYKYAVLWFVFGCVMRSLSFPFTTLGLLYLLWKSPRRGNIVFTIIALVLGGFLYAVPTYYYFGSFRAIMGTTGSAIGTIVGPRTVAWFAKNEVRNVIFLACSLNFFVVVIVAMLWSGRKTLNKNLLIFFLLVTLPYFCFLLLYVCHAGYICLLLPAFVGALWLTEERLGLDGKMLILIIAFAIVSGLQFFVARPIPYTGNTSLILNTYVLTYTRQGIKLAMFDNLKDAAAKHNLSAKD